MGREGDVKDVNDAFGAGLPEADEAPAAPATPAAESVELAALKVQIAEIAALKAQITDLLKEREERAERDSSLSQASSPRRFRVIIAEGRGGADPDRVFVGVNGRGYDIQRNVEVDVPPEVVGVLETCIAGRAVPRVNEKGITAGVDFVPNHRFPFRVIGEAVDINGVRKMPELPYQVKTRLV